MKNVRSGTHHRESRHLVPAAPSVVGHAVAERVLGGKASLRRGTARHALASRAPFCLRRIREGRLRREPNTVQFLRLAKDENQSVVDRTS